MPRETDARPADEPNETAVYWFARLVTACERNDYILADQARTMLRGHGYDIALLGPRRPKGGER